jgi:citrate synthase
MMMVQATAAGKGLEGVVATTSAVSSIIGSTLTYRGIDIDELAEYSTFAEVVYLLWNGELPSREELAKFENKLRQNRKIPDDLVGLIRQFPRNANPMVALRTAVSMLAFYDPLSEVMTPEANREKAFNLQATFPTIVATIHRLRCGQEPVAPDAGLDEASNFLYMISGRTPSELAAHVMDVALILHADHELNASTFAARIAASTLSDLDSAVVAALCTLKGPLHGGANEAVMRTLEQIGTPENVESYLRSALERKDKIMGFGHRVYKEGDPRARWLKRMSHQLSEETGNPKWYDISERIEEGMQEQNGFIAKTLLPNVDFYSASVYTYLDIPRDLFTPIFAMSRVSGWIAHVVEQFTDNRLIRPRAEYVGPSQRKYVPIDERQ